MPIKFILHSRAYCVCYPRNYVCLPSCAFGCIPRYLDQYQPTCFLKIVTHSTDFKERVDICFTILRGLMFDLQDCCGHLLWETVSTTKHAVIYMKSSKTHQIFPEKNDMMYLKYLNQMLTTLHLCRLGNMVYFKFMASLYIDCPPLEPWFCFNFI